MTESVTTSEKILALHTGDKPKYLDTGRSSLQSVMDGLFKEGLIEQAHIYENAIIKLDKEYGVNLPL
jgi:hypothetical protein